MVGWSFLFFVAPSLAVFSEASAFNSDLSNWNTGAVTSMQLSKCTLSLLLCGHDAFRSVVLVNIYDNSRFVGSQFLHSHTFFFPSFSKCSTTVASHDHSAVAHGNR